MAREVKPLAPEPEVKQSLSAPAWVGIVTAVGTALLVYTGLTTGEWRGVIVTEVQLLVVGLTTWLVLRSS